MICPFSGLPGDVAPYLSKFDLHCPPYNNVADYIIDIANLDFGEKHISKLAVAHLQQFEDTLGSMRQTNVTNLANLFKKNRYPEIYQAYQLMVRSFLTTLRDPLVFVLRLSTHVFMAFFFTKYYGDDIGIRPGCSPRIEEFNAEWLGQTMDDMEAEAKSVFNNSSSFFFLVVFCSFSAVMVNTVVY